MNTPGLHISLELPWRTSQGTPLYASGAVKARRAAEVCGTRGVSAAVIDAARVRIVV